MKKLFSAILFFFLLTGCVKVYEAEFDNLLLAPIPSELNAPEYISGVMIEVKTSDEINFDEYTEGLKIAESWSWDYDYVSNWDQETSGVFNIPYGKGEMTIYYYGEKVIWLKYNEWKITSCVVWDDGEVVCEFEGMLKGNDSEQISYYFVHGNMTTYNNFPDNYKITEVVTEGYEPNCKEFKVTTKHFYPSGNVSHIVAKRFYRAYDEEYFEGEGYYDEIIEDVYYNEDGSEMTMADRLFKGHEKYVILPAGYSIGSKGDFYIVLIPNSNDNERGYGVTITSRETNLSTFNVDRSFEYHVDGNIMTCDEFFYHMRYNTGRISNQKRRTLEIYEDFYKNIGLRGEFVLDGWEADCNMQPTEIGYSDWLLTTLKENYINER